jgi:hypothetical protein
MRTGCVSSFFRPIAQNFAKYAKKEKKLPYA